MVMRDRDNNQPVSIRAFEQDYTGYLLRQTVRETQIRNGHALVYVKTVGLSETRMQRSRERRNREGDDPEARGRRRR